MSTTALSEINKLLTTICKAHEAVVDSTPFVRNQLEVGDQVRDMWHLPRFADFQFVAKALTLIGERHNLPSDIGNYILGFYSLTLDLECRSFVSDIDMRRYCEFQGRITFTGKFNKEGIPEIVHHRNADRSPSEFEDCCRIEYDQDGLWIWCSHTYTPELTDYEIERDDFGDEDYDSDLDSDGNYRYEWQQ